MSNQTIETDYLVIGCGATAMAFVDTLLDESDASITIVDRHAKPGGHWNDAYSFVTLHQPSAYYGVNSAELGQLRIDNAGPNKGMYELASGAEVSAYFERLMLQKFLSGGRVRYYPMCNFDEVGNIVSLLSGDTVHVRVNKRIVDASNFSPSVPSTHKRGFTIASGIECVPPNALPQLWMHRDSGARVRQFCIVGAGKTAMDACIWLLRNGARADAIIWIMPRDSWLQNRLHTQPGEAFFLDSIGGEADKLDAFAHADSIDDLFARLEGLGQMLRIDPTHRPTMFHYATLSSGELELLRSIQNVIRMGRVRAIESGALMLDGGRVTMDPDTLYVDCTASAISHRPNEPVFQDGRIVIQLLRAPLLVLSSALTAYLEAHGGDDANRNRLSVPVPFPQDLAGFARATRMGMLNQHNWSQEKALRQWMRQSRLDAFGKLVAEVDKSDAPKQAVLARLRNNSMAAMGNMQQLI
jgi:hypothetical protein